MHSNVTSVAHHFTADFKLHRGRKLKVQFKTISWIGALATITYTISRSNSQLSNFRKHLSCRRVGSWIYYTADSWRVSRRIPSFLMARWKAHVPILLQQCVIKAAVAPPPPQFVSATVWHDVLF